MRSFGIGLLVLLCSQAAISKDLDLVHKQVSSSYKGLFPINFQTLILLPSEFIDAVGRVHTHQIRLPENTHQVDAISAFV